MSNLFDEFDLEVQKINIDITPYETSGGDSVAVCDGGGSGDMVPSTAPTCFNVCG